MVDLILSVIVIGPHSFQKVSQSSFVFPFNLCEGISGADLPLDQTRQPGLPLDNAVWDPPRYDPGQAGRN